MNSKRFALFAQAVLFLGALSPAWSVAGIPDPDESYFTTRATEQASIFVTPAGGGTQLNSCFYITDPVNPNKDATIELWVRDAFSDPIYLYPFSDMWLETADGGNMVLCPGGSVADQSTNIDGYTSFSSALFAGCCGSTGLNVLINGTPVNQPPADILVNSPDMDCNLVTNLSDVVLFAGYFHGSYDYCADFWWDGLVNLSDLVILAQNFIQECP